MKILKYATFLFILIFMLGAPLAVSATEDKLDTEPLTAEELAEVLENKKFEKLTSYIPRGASSFDIGDDNALLIGANENYDFAYIVVYDEMGCFQYGFRIPETGKSYVFWIGENIGYYSIRGSKIYTIDKEGNIIDVVRVLSTTKNYTYQHDVLDSRTQKVGNYTYTLTNENAFLDFFGPSYKKIIKTSEDGTDTVVYDATKSQGNNSSFNIQEYIPIILIFTFIITPLVAGINLLIVPKMVKNRISHEKKRRQEENNSEEN